VLRLFFCLTTIAILTATFAGCGEPSIARQSTDGTTRTVRANNRRPPAHIADPHLENAYRIHAKVISGGEPHGDKGFESLKRLGVKTIISVDGAKPDLKRAWQLGMRYVHLPHSYDGVPEDRAKELAKAIRDLEGPVYIHCHHGKHRSPAAAAVACVGAGLINAADALAILTTAGTSTNYRGLYESAEQARRFDDALLDALDVQFREVVEVPPLADAMVALERTHDHVLQIAAGGWRPLPENPDLDLAHEVLLLREHYTELLRSNELTQRPVEFQMQMRRGEEAAKSLEDTLARLKEQRYSPGPLNLHKSADAALATISQNCAACHEKFRDVPLGEK
jgi:protein tyrosine phosphatase (PTP) superfamily phosphohydrolase (DUF442 family)